MTNDPLREAARALMEAVENDENRHGGTLNRETLRLASLLRIELNRKPPLRKATDLSAVMVEPDGVLKASAVAAVMCENGEVGLLFLDRDSREFARAPLVLSAVHWLRGQLASLIDGAKGS
ncbi:hypothetical protein [Bosea sp. (in: a-proteobacteria)]|uniref:hypothetical protein n=1 Tax=Bosea sp. (in: a-proteobacteria) TaxID=1871050 RepID=UPI00262873CA|nr:hypothetical protein [Bosea sp. (in: a-proteobacteria)]MCO5091982.1 hypothetical protein [Bosea sp. (in: a-proteobacteria)]